MHDKQGLDDLGESHPYHRFVKVALSNLIFNGILQVSAYVVFGHDVQKPVELKKVIDLQKFWVISDFNEKIDLIKPKSLHLFCAFA